MFDTDESVLIYSPEVRTSSALNFILIVCLAFNVCNYKNLLNK